MKILLSHRYFWPDTSPYATMLRSIAKRLAAEGHDVTVFATQPSYHASEGLTAPKRESLDGFQVVRMPIFRERKGNLPLRGFNVLAYGAGLRRHILKTGDYDIVTAATFPPVAAARAAAGAARKIGAKFIYHFQDLHPEVSLYSGQLKQGRIFRSLQAVDSKTCHMADALVLLSSDMADSLKQRPGNAGLKTDIINNFFLESFDEEQVEDSPPFPDDAFTILFAGNIGNFQNLDKVIAAAHKLTDLESVQFWFMGDGAAKKRLTEQAGALQGKTVFFLPFAHHSVAQDLMGRASLNLVSLKPDIYRVAYPSKTLSILSRSVPILAAIESQSALAKMVTSEQIGYVADQTSADAIAQAVRTAWLEKEKLPEMRKNVARFYNEALAQDKILDRWCALVERLGAEGQSD